MPRGRTPYRSPFLEEPLEPGAFGGEYRQGGLASAISRWARWTPSFDISFPDLVRGFGSALSGQPVTFAEPVPPMIRGQTQGAPAGYRPGVTPVGRVATGGGYQFPEFGGGVPGGPGASMFYGYPEYVSNFATGQTGVGGGGVGGGTNPYINPVGGRVPADTYIPSDHPLRQPYYYRWERDYDSPTGYTLKPQVKGLYSGAYAEGDTMQPTGYYGQDWSSTYAPAYYRDRWRAGGDIRAAGFSTGDGPNLWRPYERNTTRRYGRPLPRFSKRNRQRQRQNEPEPEGGQVAVASGLVNWRP